MSLHGLNAVNLSAHAPPNLNCASAIALHFAPARNLDLEEPCILRFMAIRLNRFILANLVGLCIFPRV